MGYEHQRNSECYVGRMTHNNLVVHMGASVHGSISPLTESQSRLGCPALVAYRQRRSECRAAG
jgi:cytoskeletal protein CcmA (bactofilin family)